MGIKSPSSLINQFIWSDLAAKAGLILFGGQAMATKTENGKSSQVSASLVAVYKLFSLQKDRFLAFATATSQAIFIYQKDRYIYVNPACETLTGYTTSELLSMRIV